MRHELLCSRGRDRWAAGMRAFLRLLPIGLLAAALALAALPSPVPAQDKPFGPPFAEPPGLGTWFLSQPYGNSVYAYFERGGIYRSGQGLHMGVDFAAACGTPVVAIGDGVVLHVDGPGGAGPHNMMIDHENGYVSFYGHLMERPRLAVGQRVARGEAIALSGDMYGTCHDSPHLHLEIRDRGLNRLFNPVDFVDLDWHSLSLMGGSPMPFERDLAAPRRWQSLDAQPEITIGGPLLNDYVNAWPPDGSQP